jgi:hypothetical protein
MLTRLIFMNPFHVGLAAIRLSPSNSARTVRTDYRSVINWLLLGSTRFY